jgi:hypothetical protein
MANIYQIGTSKTDLTLYKSFAWKKKSDTSKESTAIVSGVDVIKQIIEKCPYRNVMAKKSEEFIHADIVFETADDESAIYWLFLYK